MAEAYSTGPAASLLAAAWRGGKQLNELPAEIRPRTLSEGYAVQDDLIAKLGEKSVGWKLGLGSPQAMRMAGIDRPVVGRILKSHLHRSGDVVQLPNRAPVTIEFEIALTLARDILPGDVPIAPEDAFSTAHAAFELVLSRYVDRRAVGRPSFVADNSGFEASVVGCTIDPGRIGAIVSSVSVSADSEVRAGGLTGEELTDPFSALAGLMAHARERGLTLRKGEIVSAGAVARPFDIAKDATIVARYLESELRMQIRLP
jgi:2-keto-4-pentenoate hydratase